MKYILNQTVYYITFEQSKIGIESMVINNMGLERKITEQVVYTSFVTDSDWDLIKLKENQLFVTYNDALLEISKQLEELKNER